MPDCPNLLIFITDEQRFDHIGLAGRSPVHTPSIDALAAEGTRFDSCYTSCPACMPARQTLLTGRVNRAQGVRQNGNPLPRDIPVLPALLRAGGYRTHAAGKLHLRASATPIGADLSTEDPIAEPERNVHWQNARIRKAPDDYYGFEHWDSTVGHGSSDILGDFRVWLEANHPDALPCLGHFDRYTGDRYPWDEADIDPSLHYNHWIADRSIDFLDQCAEGAAPFFLWCSFPDPHSPFIGLKDYADLYRRMDFELPPHDADLPLDEIPETLLRQKGGADGFQKAAYRFGGEENLRELHIQTFAMIHHIDEQIGRVMAALRQNGQDENTVVVFMSDHGEMLGEHGLMHKMGWPYDGCARVPFIVRPTAPHRRARTVEEPVSFIDFAPTLLDWAGVPQPEDPGVTPEYRETAAPLQPPLPGESLRNVVDQGATPSRQHALVEFDNDLEAHFECLQMRMLVTADYKFCYYRPTGECLLYDRRRDPGEHRNLAQSPEYASVREQLLRQLLDEVMRTDVRLPRRLNGA